MPVPVFEMPPLAPEMMPETLTVSQILAYHLGETEQSIDSEIELDVREAPLRELLLRLLLLSFLRLLLLCLAALTHGRIVIVIHNDHGT